MKDLYSFELPEQLIAQKPASPRDSARLLVYRLSDGSIVDSVFSRLGEFIHPKTTLAVNNSKVENCRWLFDGGKTELFVLEKLDANTIRALVRPGRKFKPGKTVQLTEWLSLETIETDNEGIRTIKLSVPHDDPRLGQHEHIPLPPYIAQNDKLADEYQTVYARPLGSLAAPTAGLHFTNRLISRLRPLHPFAAVTLHVGLGTFAKLTDDNLKTGRLHEEFFELDADNARLLDEAEHITAVGTTTVRTLESIRRDSNSFKPASGRTDIFIRPGYEFRSVDSIITNFHLPETSLLMLVAAFIADKRGLDEEAAAKELMRVYSHAINSGYRFYSFGDAMLIV